MFRAHLRLPPFTIWGGDDCIPLPFLDLTTSCDISYLCLQRKREQSATAARAGGGGAAVSAEEAAAVARREAARQRVAQRTAQGFGFA